MTTNILNPDWRLLVAGSVAEVDPAQIAILRQFTPAQRIKQGFLMIQSMERVAVQFLRQRKPHLTEKEAIQIISRGVLPS